MAIFEDLPFLINWSAIKLIGNGMQWFVKIKFKTRIEAFDRVYVFKAVLVCAACHHIRIGNQYIAFVGLLRLAQVISEASRAKTYIQHLPRLKASESSLIIGVFHHVVV